MRALALLLLLAASAPATTVSVSGRQLLVNCAPFIMRGMNYSPAAIGQGVGSFDWYSNSALLAADVAAMKAMGVNTVRVYLDYGHVWNNSGGDPYNDPATNPTVVANVNAALSTFYNNGIYVILNYWLPYHSALMSSPIPRQWEKIRFQKLIRTFKSHPAVLMWVLGNENNASWNRSITAPQLFGFLQEAVAEAKSAEAPPQPISVVLIQTASDGVTQDHLNPALLNSAPAVDLWGLNLYQSVVGTASAIDAYGDARPLWLAEFGQDAWNANSASVDTASQAGFYQTRWANAIGPRLSALNSAQKLVGACAFEWNDEWHKDGAGTWGAHDLGGGPLNNDNDNYANEEWFGLSAALAAGASGPRSYRPAYTTLQSLWTAAPYNTVPPASCCPSCPATATPTRTATPNPCLPVSFDDFESLNLSNSWGGAWGASQQDNAVYANPGLVGNSGGGISYGFSTVGNWSVLYSSLGPTSDPSGNSGTGSGLVDLSPWGQVRFWAKSTAPGTYYFCVASTLALSPGYGWYRAPFTVGTGWNEVVLNLNATTFGNPGGNYGTWAQNAAAATQFTVLPAAGLQGVLNLDGVRLTRWCGVPTPTATRTPFGSPTPTPNICLPQTLADFESGTALNSWGGVWNQAQEIGNGAVTVAAGGQSGQGLRWDYNATAGWAVLFMGLEASSDPAGNAGAGSGVRDLRSYGRISVWVKASVAGAYYFKVASNTNDSNSYSWYQAPFNATTSWTLQTFDLGGAAFVNPGNNSASWSDTLSRATQFAISPQGATTAALQLDGLQLQAWCGLPSPTATASPSRTGSASATTTLTGTLTPGSTQTATSTRSATPSATRSSSPTRSASPTATPSASRTATPSRTASPTPTATASASPSASPTVTLTASQTVTPTWSPVPPGSSATATPTASPSSTPTPSASPTASPSATPSATPTVTATATATASPTATLTRTASATLSASPTATPTSSATGSSTASATLSATPSATPVWTHSTTASPTATVPAPTAVPQGPCRIDQVVAVPNPNPRYLAIHSEGAADAVELRIYSKVLTLARTSQRAQALSLGWNHLDLEAGLMEGLPNGLYFVVVKPSRGQRPGIAAPIAKLYVLR